MAEFIIGRLKFVWRGTWQAATLYRKDDVIRYGAKSYVALANHSSSADFYTDSANWDLMNDGQEWKNTWPGAGTKINVGDIYKYGNILYICTQDHTSSATFDFVNYDVFLESNNWTGNYTQGYYYLNDIMKWGSHVYITTTEHDAASNVEPDLGNFQLFVPGLTWENTWSDATVYQINDLVKYGNNIYIVTTQHTSSGDIDYTKFDLFLPGLTFEDSWDVGTNYQTGDIVTYGGYTYVAVRDSVGVIPYNNLADWEVLSTGYNFAGTWAALTAYKTGDVVRYGGNTYVARVDTLAGQLPTDVLKFDLILEGITFVGTWNVGTQYLVGQVVEYSTNSYRAVIDNTGNQPDISPAQWQIVAQGDSQAVMTTQGDIAYHNGTQIARLPLGAAGSRLVSNGTDVLWSTPSSKVYYVATHGFNTNAGSKDLPFRNIKHACSVATSGDVIFVEQGVYEEDIPIQVPAGVSLYGDSLRGCEVRPDLSANPNGASETMFLLNNAVNIRNFSFRGLNGGIVMALDPTGSITTQSPYIQNCSSFNENSTGIKVDGSVQASGYHSILANDFTMINNDGIGVHVLNNGRAELVSIFTYYCDKGYFAESGGFIRALNGSNSYGEYGAHADGSDPNETPITVATRGEQLRYSEISLSGTLNVGDTITGAGGATATIIRHVDSTQRIKIDNITGSFVDGETCTTSGGASLTLLTPAQSGQTGYLFELEGVALQSADVIRPGANIQFAGDTTYYTVTAITDEDLVSGYAQVRVNIDKTTGVSAGAVTTISSGFSNVRLTGHDFLNIGTGDFTTTNYPNTPTQPALQERETNETNGGRVYYVSTDQSGNFRVGEYFRVDQATGTATLNADAFDLSGLTELQLGSIGAQLGATINEFSTDVQLTGNSDTAVPTERAVKTYVDTSIAAIQQNAIVQGNSSITVTDVGTGSIGIVVDATSIATVDGNGITMVNGNFIGNVQGNVTGNLTGNADTVTVASDVSSATRYVTFSDATAGNLSPKINTGFTYNPGTGELTATIVTASSDARLKENVVGIENALDTVCKLAGVEYNRIGSGAKELGVIAQDVEVHVPQLVSTNDEGYKSVAYGNMNALIIEAIKEIKLQLDEIKGKL